ncbi:Plastid-lipid associated protein PAP / fibrillin family protein [Hibiscus syriacus]|uniref:Plastid-lipid associated protein PAP / fibrillin family protein n=1 Tax=Hibiscus syriacus TaxID=106335 RepID=A0A6A3CCD3_HIBSY|nr:Plastid-lipid associated protein PAP / fibrillin family protein [Hibiscus syriacus]
MAPTPSSTSKQTQTQIRTPQSKHRLNFNSTRNNNNPAVEANHPSGEHPVEVIGRIRNQPGEQSDKNPISYLHINPDNKTLRVRADIGYRDFSLDGISSSEEEDLDTFYKKFVQSRIDGVKTGAKCTIMMYGPTAAGKSHTMFGCSKQPGIVYRSLKDILGDLGKMTVEGKDWALGLLFKLLFWRFIMRKFMIFCPVMVEVVLELDGLKAMDLRHETWQGQFLLVSLSCRTGVSVKLEVMGKKAKNATFISGSEAGKISKEIQKVEKRRIVKSTLCNERSSRSHCMIILDVPTVGGRLMLVDMAGSENIDQAGQAGFEAKMQTAKINQGNIALKRVVESIANGDSHVPFRDSKLTMLLQDSFEDDQSKILMIICASPDPKEIHKTICTLEYGAKAKCIVRGPHTPLNDKNEDSSAVNLGSRLAAMDQFINKLQMESKQREREKDEARKALEKKEQEVAALRSLLEVKGSGVTENEINLKVNERTQMLKLELERKLDECKRMAEEFVEMERRRMEERILQQQEEVEMLRKRLQEIEIELRSSRDGNEENESSNELDGSSFAKRLIGIYGDEVPGMVMSMELDMNDPEPYIHAANQSETDIAPRFGVKPGLSTVCEEEETEEEDEVEKVIIEEKRICSNEKAFESVMPNQLDSDTLRPLRIQNIFTLCGNQRELSQQTRTPAKSFIDPHWSFVASDDSVVKSLNEENQIPADECTDGQIDVYVKWESSKENPGKFITTLKVTKDATLADLRKLIDIYLDVDNQAFAFIVLGDPTGATVPKENEAIFKASKLPICNNGYLACLRPAKGLQITNHLPLSPLQLTPLPLTPLENKLLLATSTLLSNQGDDLSPKLSPHLSTTPFINAQRRR